MTALTLVAQGAELNTHNLRTWMLDNVVPLLLLAVAVLLLWLGGGKGDNAGVMRRVGGVIIALGVVGLAGVPGQRDVGAASDGGGADLCQALCPLHLGWDCRGG